MLSNMASTLAPVLAETSKKRALASRAAARPSSVGTSLQAGMSGAPGGSEVEFVAHEDEHDVVGLVALDLGDPEASVFEACLFYG